MQSQDVSMAPPAFPKLPKSALFSKLQSFLPVMEQENKKLEQALAAGEGAKHSIEVDDSVASSTAAQDDSDSADKPPVIEMNFALGMMEDDATGDASDDDSSDDDGDGEDSDALKAAVLAAAGAGRASQSEQDTATAFDLKLSNAQAKPSPMIQELN